ncbi:hypothetical protein lerEdw1_009360, partial [Lerista edwardsae]
WPQAPDSEGKLRLRCVAQGESAGSWFYLYQGDSQFPTAEEKALPTQSEVTFVVHSFDPIEPFRCSYEIREAGKSIHSPLSDPANFTDNRFPKPSIAASPDTEVPAGQDWTICCWAPFPGMNFVLYHGREFQMEVTPRGDSSMAEFSVKNVTGSDAGQYTCYYHSITEPVIWSNASDSVQLKVIDGAEILRYQEVLVDSEGRYSVNCSVPSTSEGWFYLYRNGQLLAETRAWNDGETLSFNLTEEALDTTKGVLSCQYGENQLNDSKPWKQELLIREYDSCHLANQYFSLHFSKDSHSRSTYLTTASWVRLGLGAGILSLTLLFIADAFWSKQHQEN